MIHHENGTAYAFASLPRSAFPFTIEYFSVDDPAGTHPIRVDHVNGPGALRVPPLSTILGRPVWVRMRCADGSEQDEWPPGWEKP